MDLSRISTSLLTLLLSASVLGQTSTSELTPPPSDASDNSGQRFEKIQVTGSHIRKIDVEGVAPLDIIDSKEFVNSGSIEIGQVLREDPAFEAVYGNVGNVRFRGQHAGNVLILLNGLRMPKLNGGYYTPINNLPTAAIGQVELLKDGGSAVYGSDAMSGVMNFITKTNYDGSNILLSTSAPENGIGMQRNVEGTFGKNFSRGNIMAVIQYENTEGFNETDLGSLNRRDGLSRTKTSNVSVGELNVGPTNCAGSSCQTDRLIYDQSRPDNQDLSALLTGMYEFNSFNVSFLGLYNRKTSTLLDDPRELDWTNQSSRGGINNAVDFSAMQPSTYRDEIQNSGSVDNGFVDIEGSLVDELGDYIRESEVNSYNAQLLVSGLIGMDWDWKVTTGYSLVDSTDTVVSGEVDQNRLRELFLSGNFNILAPQGSKSDVSSALINPVYRNTGALLTNKAVVAGELFDLGSFYEGGGPVSMAVGTEFQNETFEFNNDETLVNGTALGLRTRNFSGSRDVRSAFLEFSAYPVEQLEVQLAGRVDSYSDVGETFNPKFALAYRPFKPVLLRGSVSTGFRAPGITDIYAGDEETLQELEDQVDCRDNGRCDETLKNVTTYTTPDTDPETALSYSFGTVVQPFKRTTISIDQWNFEGENTLTALRSGDYTEIEAMQGAAGLGSVGATIVRNPDGSIQSMRFPRVINIGERSLRGVDVAIDSNIDVGNGFDLITGSGMSFIFERRQKRFDFEEMEDLPDSWKNRAYIGLKNDNHFFRTSMLTVSKQLVGRGRFQETLPQYSEFDMTYGYTASWGGNFNFAIKNIANSRPPAQNDSYITFGNPDRNYSSFSPLRRRLYVAYSQTF
jgi:iron complex outermembrane receptor protein